ncbi:hypothetical protein DRN39_07305 [Thermococci archaeon]|nr:MAG: hypothetical protein DRN39_07305 [Thermococci archaeon]
MRKAVLVLLVLLGLTAKSGQFAWMTDVVRPLVLQFMQMNFEGTWEVYSNSNGCIQYTNKTDSEAKVEILRSDGLYGWIKVPENGIVLVCGSVAHFLAVSDFELPLKPGPWVP